MQLSIQEAYNLWSDTYDPVKNLTRDLDENVTEKTLGDLRVDSILEIGCGTGKNTRFLTGIAKSVQAIDFAEGMIQKARTRPGLENVTFTLADITQDWPCENETVDLISCNLVLEHVEDLLFVFREAKRTLRNGGRFFISELHPFRQYLGKKARFETGNQKIEVTAFVHHFSDFFEAASCCQFVLRELKEWWHAEDTGKPPRLISFIFEKPAISNGGFSP